MAPILRARKLRLKEIRLKSPTSRANSFPSLRACTLGLFAFCVRLAHLQNDPRSWGPDPLRFLLPPQDTKSTGNKGKNGQMKMWKFCTSTERLNRMPSSPRSGRRRLQPRSREQVNIRRSPASPLLWLATKGRPRLVAEGQVGS